MPTFQVTVNPPELKGQRGTEQAISVTVTNTLERPATARVMLRPGPSSPGAWVTPPPDNLGRYPSRNASQQFTFTLRIPADAPAGSYSLLFDVVDTDLPDDHFGTSAPMSFVLAPLGSPVPTPQAKPRWWILVAAAVLVIGLGVVVWKVFFDKGEMKDLREKKYLEGVASLAADTTVQFSILRADTLSRDTMKYKPGTIVAQSIRPGAKLRDSVNMLILTVQRSFTAVPSVVGKELTEAAALLGKDSLFLEMYFRTYRHAKNTDSIKVVQTIPPPGALVGRGQRVTLIVATPIPCDSTGRCMPVGNWLQLIDGGVKRMNTDAMAGRRP